MWTANRNSDATAETIYEIMKKHYLIPENPRLAAAACNSLHGAEHYVVSGPRGEKVADLLVSAIFEGDSATIDLIPVAAFFRSGFDEPLFEAVRDIIGGLFEGAGVRRLTAMFPASRPRTKRALGALGFVPEGRIRDGVKIYGRKPEDLRVMGLLKREWERKCRDVVAA